MKFKSLESGIEVNGQTVYAIVDGFGPFKDMGADILVKAGIGKMDPKAGFTMDAAGWYSQDDWLAAFQRVADKLGDQVLYAIGFKIPANAVFPPWVIDIESAMRSIDIAYHLNHRKKGKVMFQLETQEMLEGIGHYGYELLPKDPTTQENKIVSVCKNPYPCHFDRGIVTAMATRFEPTAWVKHDDSVACRNHGGDSCTYVVTWRSR